MLHADFAKARVAQKKVKVALVDDHAVVRRGLREYLESHEDIHIVAEAGNGREAMNLVRDHSIDVLVLDLTMPQFSGLDALASLKARSPDTGILIFSGLPVSLYAITLLQQGVDGYLNKDCDPDEVVRAIRVIGDGRRYLTNDVAELLAQEVFKPRIGLAHETLKTRELQIFLKIAQGEDVASIGRILNLSTKTVSTYRTRTFKKLGLESNSEATYYALKHGLID